MPQTADNLLSDPEIATAYEDVRSDKSATTWMVLKYISGTSDALKLDSTGEGEISEMVEHLGDDEATYAFVRMTVGNDELSQRVKFVFVSWCGPNTRVMRRAKMTTQIGQVKQVLRSYAIEIQTDSKTDLKDSEVTMKLRKAMGANCTRPCWGIMPQSQPPSQEGQAPTQPRQGNLNFITFGEPQQSPSTRAIRSHAAKEGWKSRKKSKSIAAAAQTPLPRATTENAPAALLAPPRLVEDDEEEEMDSHALAAATSLMLSESQSARMFKPHQLGSTHDPFQQFPVRWEESFGPLVQFYRTRIGEVWMGMIAVDWGQQGNTEFVDFPLQVSIAQREPAMFYAVLSNTSVMAPPSNAISMRQQPFMSQWLRHKAVEALRKAITDPTRAYTDSVIMTVIYVYFNEALRSERDIAVNVHAPALKRMVAARGGLKVIASNGKDGLILSRYLTWCDRIISNTLGTPLLFGDYVEDLTVGKTQWNGMWSKVQTIM
ncbi:hypothetical protein D6D25_04809 [Aureobasidium pullulans]|nr:hypothetical protein D6D25_04809 [Aureobasidium pullulans]